MEELKGAVIDKFNYVPGEIIYETLTKSQTVPDQSLTIEEILSRHTRGLPADVHQFDPVYFDDENYDLEKIARSDFAEKFDLEAAMREQARRQKDELEREAMERTNEPEREDEPEKSAKPGPKKRAAKKTGIGDLDNTMPVDTDTDDQ